MHNHANLYQKSLDVYLNDQVLKTVFMDRFVLHAQTLNPQLVLCNPQSSPINQVDEDALNPKP